MEINSAGEAKIKLKCNLCLAGSCQRNLGGIAGGILVVFSLYDMQKKAKRREEPFVPNIHRIRTFTTDLKILFFVFISDLFPTETISHFYSRSQIRSPLKSIKTNFNLKSFAT